MYILHPCIDRNKAAINQHREWPNLSDDIRTHIKVCKKIRKKGNKNSNIEN